MDLVFFLYRIVQSREGKLSRPVLRGGRSGNAVSLPGHWSEAFSPQFRQFGEPVALRIQLRYGRLRQRVNYLCLVFSAQSSPRDRIVRRVGYGPPRPTSGQTGLKRDVYSSSYKLLLRSIDTRTQLASSRSNLAVEKCARLLACFDCHTFLAQALRTKVPN